MSESSPTRADVDAPLEAALAAAEARVGAAVRTATGVVRELRRAQAAAAAGELRQLDRSVRGAADAADRLAAEVDGLRGVPDLDAAEHLASGRYLKELLAAAQDAGLSVFEEDGRLLCYPSLVSVVPGELAIEVDRARDRRLRPSGVVRRLAAAQQRGPRFRAEAFLGSLADAYDLVVAAQGKPPTAVVRLVDVHRVLTLLPGQGRDYGRQEFARDLYLLDQSAVATTKDGRPMHWAASTGTRQAGLLTTVSRSGQQQRYWGVSFGERRA